MYSAPILFGLMAFLPIVIILAFFIFRGSITQYYWRNILRQMLKDSQCRSMLYDAMMQESERRKKQQKTG